MEYIEFSVGFGGWCAVACLILLIANKSFHPILAIFIPFLTITMTLLVLTIVRYILYFLVWALSTMLLPSVVYAFFPACLLALFVFVFTDTYRMVSPTLNAPTVVESPVDDHVD